MRIFTSILIILCLCSCSKHDYSNIDSEQDKTLILQSNSFSPASAVVVVPEPVSVELGLPEEVEKYVQELILINSNPNASQGVEGLLRLGRAAAEVLVRSPNPNKGVVDILERLSEEKFQEVILKMRGFSVNRQETVFVEPVPDFFLEIAKRSGDQASIDFFESYNQTKPNGGWPVYVEQQTDYSGCIRFGTMSLIDTYTLWQTYSSKYPSRYINEIKAILNDVEFDLKDGTCACQKTESAIEEFEKYVQAYPNNSISVRLRERINQYKQGKSDIRGSCLSG